MILTLSEQNLNALRVCLSVMAKDDVRYYLNGVNLEISKNRMVATDGHRMFVAQMMDPNDYKVMKSEIKEFEKKDSFIFCIRNPSDTKKPVVKIPKSWIEARIDLDKMTISGYASRATEVPIGTFIVEEIDAKYPEIERVVQMAKDAEVDPMFSEISVNVKYLASAAESFKNNNFVEMHMSFRNFNSAMMFDFPDLTVPHFGILMPVTKKRESVSVYAQMSELGF